MGEMIDTGELPEEATVDAEPLLCRVLGAVVHGCGVLGSRLVADIPVLVVYCVRFLLFKPRLVRTQLTIVTNIIEREFVATASYTIL